jgi:hypothetical protein
MAKNGSIPAVLIEMTNLALGGEPGRKMIWFLSFSVILLMTIKTCYFPHIEAMLTMAICAV